MANPRVEKLSESAAITEPQAFRAVDGGTNPVITSIVTPASRHRLENGISGVALPRRSRRRSIDKVVGRPANFQSTEIPLIRNQDGGDGSHDRDLPEPRKPRSPGEPRRGGGGDFPPIDPPRGREFAGEFSEGEGPQARFQRLYNDRSPSGVVKSYITEVGIPGRLFDEAREAFFASPADGEKLHADLGELTLDAPDREKVMGALDAMHLDENLQTLKHVRNALQGLEVSQDSRHAIGDMFEDLSQQYGKEHSDSLSTMVLINMPTYTEYIRAKMEFTPSAPEKDERPDEEVYQRAFRVLLEDEPNAQRLDEIAGQIRELGAGGLSQGEIRSTYDALYMKALNIAQPETELGAVEGRVDVGVFEQLNERGLLSNFATEFYDRMQILREAGTEDNQAVLNTLMTTEHYHDYVFRKVREILGPKVADMQEIDQEREFQRTQDILMDVAAARPLTDAFNLLARLKIQQQTEHVSKEFALVTLSDTARAVRVAFPSESEFRQKREAKEPADPYFEEARVYAGIIEKGLAPEQYNGSGEYALGNSLPDGTNVVKVAVSEGTGVNSVDIMHINREGDNDTITTRFVVDASGTVLKVQPMGNGDHITPLTTDQVNTYISEMSGLLLSDGTEIALFSEESSKATAFQELAKQLSLKEVLTFKPPFPNTSLVVEKQEDTITALRYSMSIIKDSGLRVSEHVTTYWEYGGGELPKHYETSVLQVDFGRNIEPAGDEGLMEASLSDVGGQLPPLPDSADRSTASSRNAKAGLTYLRGIADQVKRGIR